MVFRRQREIGIHTVPGIRRNNTEAERLVVQPSREDRPGSLRPARAGRGGGVVQGCRRGDEHEHGEHAACPAGPGLEAVRDGNGQDDDVLENTKTPEESLGESYQALRNALADELLERMRSCSPQFFERLVVELLVAMGYGGSLTDAGQAIGRSGDGGIDGIIKEDRLGLDAVCIQAKRWEKTVGRPEVQAFAGSMEGFRARKGVMLTTSTFSKDAEEYIHRIERKIVLIDGRRLAQLMIDHDVGVTTARSYVVKKLDLDYFEEDAG